VGTRRRGNSKSSDLAIVLGALGEVWAEHHRQELEPQPARVIRSQPRDARLHPTSRPASNVIALDARRAPEVATAS
jgi:hypothetical protein